MNAPWLYIRLAFALAVVLAPGWAIARALGVRGAPATVAWSLGSLAGAVGVTFAAGGSLDLTLALHLAIGALVAVCVLGVRRRRRGLRDEVTLGIGSAALVAAGVLLGVLLWSVAGAIGGDGFFHLARVQKLLAFGDLSVSSLNEFPDGSPHPGYAFPLWHGLLALVARIAAADPTSVALHLPSLLAPLAVVCWAEAGWALFRRRIPAITTAGAAVALAAFASGHGGAYTALALPATTSRQLLVPALLALAFTAVRSPRPSLLLSTGVCALALAAVHPTYVVFVWIPFAGFLIVRALWSRGELREGGLTLTALVVPAAVFLALLIPLVGDTASVTPDAEERARAFSQYAGQLRGDPDRFAVVPELFGRSGAVAVAALLLVPLAAFATRRRWSAFVAGGGLAVAAVTLLPFLFVPFTDLLSVSQGRRLVGFFPFQFALAGGLGVLAALAGPLAAPLALAGAVTLQRLYPGDFDYFLTDGGPAWATWIAVAGALAALLLGLRRRLPLERSAALAGLVVLLPTFVHGLANWSPSPARLPNPLSTGLVEALRDEVPVGATVYSDPEASYRIAAAVPVRICVAPPGHVADTEQNRPRARVQEFRRFARTGDSAIPRGCGATWLVVDLKRFPQLTSPTAVYRDPRWLLLRLSR
jgi:hypothetical protein